jgi:hypothetical protein
MQHAVNTTIEEEVFSIWFACIHCWATDMFYGSSSRLYKWYRTESRENEGEREWGESSAVKKEGFS